MAYVVWKDHKQDKVEISDFCIWRDGEMKNSELFCVAFELHVKGKVKAVISEHEHFSVVKLELLDFVLAFILEEEVQLFWCLLSFEVYIFFTFRMYFSVYQFV